MRMVMLAVMCVVVLGAVGGESKRVAIVGAGIGGSSLAHFLSEADDSLELHVFERRQVGGRMANVEERMDALVREGKEKGGEEGEKKVVVELGGTIYHRVNSLVAALLKKTGLEGHHADDGLDTDTFGIWKGDSFGFQSVSLPALPWFEKALNIFQMVTRFVDLSFFKSSTKFKFKLKVKIKYQFFFYHNKNLQYFFILFHSVTFCFIHSSSS